MENMFKGLLKTDIITITMLISVIASVYGVFLLPAVVEGLAADGGFFNYFIFIFSIIAVFILIAGLFSRLIMKLSLPSKASGQGSFSELLKGLLWLVLAGVAAVLAISIGYGFLAVFIRYIFRDFLSLDKIKTIINVVTNIITVLVMPLFVRAFFNFLGGMKPAVSITGAFKNIKTVYLKLLPPILFIYIIGLLLSWPMGLLAADVPGKVIRVLLLSMAGTGSLLLMLAVNDTGICREG